MYPTWLPPHLHFLWDLPELDLLRALIAGEAAGETYVGMVAVAWVPMNRTRYAEWSLVPWFARSLRENVLMPAQFSCFWADWMKRNVAVTSATRGGPQWNMEDQAARGVLNGTEIDITLGADHYFNPGIVRPTWAARLSRTVRIGHHDFYTSTI